MKIGIYCNSMMTSCRGMGRYTREIVLCMTRLDKQNSYILYTCKPINFKIPHNFKEHIIPQNEIIAEQFYLPYRSKKDELDVLWCPSNTFPIFLSPKIKLIVTIHDLIFLEKYDSKTSVSFRQRIGKLYRRFVVLQGKKRINACLTVSKYSAKQIEKILGISNVKVTYNCIDSFYELVKSTFPNIIRKNYYFTVSGDAPSKNLSFLIDIFNELLPNEKLIIAGVAKNAKIREKENKNITFLPIGIDDIQLIKYYKECKAFVFISLFEGFGIPILEALICNTPIVCSNSTSIPEIVAQYGLQVNPRNKKEIAQALLKINLFDFDKKGKETHINKFLKWEDSAQIVINQFYK